MEKWKIALWIVLGVLGTVLLFSLIVCVCCSVNGLTFGEQICAWFSGNKAVVDASVEAVQDIANTPIS